MTRVWVLYRVVKPPPGKSRYAAWLYLIDAAGRPQLHGANRGAGTLRALWRLIPKGFGPDPRFVPGRLVVTAAENGSKMTALEGWTR